MPALTKSASTLISRVFTLLDPERNEDAPRDPIRVLTATMHTSGAVLVLLLTTWEARRATKVLTAAGLRVIHRGSSVIYVYVK